MTYNNACILYTYGTECCALCAVLYLLSGPGSSVGYHVRLDASITRHTRLTFATTGILLRRLAGELTLASLTHVVVDEVRACCCWLRGVCGCVHDLMHELVHISICLIAFSSRLGT